MRTNVVMLVTLFFTAAVPGFACGQCGTFTTMAFLWLVTFPAIFYLALVAMLQFWLFKERPGKKLAASAVLFFIFAYMSYDLTWILLLTICLYQIGRQVHILVKHSDESTSARKMRRLIISLYGVFPVLVVAGMVEAAVNNNGVIFYRRYSSPAVRAKVAKVKSDLRDMAHALEAYYEDNNAFPQPNAELTLPIAVMTTPIAYYSGHIPADVLLPDKPPIRYMLSDDYKTALVISKGPDWKPQILPDKVPWEEMQAGFEETQAALIFSTYDPTNGTFSDGDIYRSIQAPEKK